MLQIKGSSPFPLYLCIIAQNNQKDNAKFSVSNYSQYFTFRLHYLLHVCYNLFRVVAKMKTGKRLFRIVLCVVLIMLAVYIILDKVPIPRKIEIPMVAYEVSKDGIVIAEEEIIFSATRYRYLLRDNVVNSENLKIDEMKFSDLSFKAMDFRLKGELSTYRPEYDHAFYSAYIASCHGLEHMNVYIDKEEQWLLFSIEDGSNYLICTADPSITPAEIMEICRDELK